MTGEEKRNNTPTEAVEEHEAPAQQPRHSEDVEKGHSRPVSIEAIPPSLYQTRSHISTHDGDVVNHHDEHYEVGDEIYNKFSSKHKVIMVTVLSFSSFLAPIGSTTILAASPEVVSTFNTTGAIFGISNALYMVFMGLSALVYGPLGTTVRTRLANRCPRHC